MKEEQRNIINSIKLLGIDMINQAGYGYPGIVLSAAPIIYTLYANHMNINPKEPNWINRDRFVLSASHASSLLYATLFMAGYDITLDDLVKYRMLDSKTPGFVNMNKTPGIDFSTGPLGQGLASAVGMAMAEKYLESLISNTVKKQRLIDHKIYVLVSDGDLQTGLAKEAISMAGLNNLGNLIVLYDSNNVTADGDITKSSKENITKIFDANGWYTDYIADGDNVEKIDKAIKRAKRVLNKPALIEIRTILGKDSFNQGTNMVHDHPLSLDDVKSLRRLFKNDKEKFEVIKKHVDIFRSQIDNRCNKIYKLWNEYYDAFKKTQNKEVQEIVNFFENGNLAVEFRADNFKIQATYQEELVESNSKIMNVVSNRTKYFLGGSADVFSGTRTYLSKEGDFSPTNYYGRNIYFGVREHAMASILNGISSYGLLVYGSTYLRFLDYQKDSVREAAMNNLPVTFIYTHDCLTNSLDGEEYYAFEQLTTLRTIPNLLVLRPADINEVIGCWDVILKEKKTTALVLSIEKIHILAGTDSTKVKNGAYIVRKEKNKLDAILMTSGFDLTVSLVIAEELFNEGIDVRVVSCVSQEIFDKQSDEYKNEILGGAKVICMESSNPLSWCRYTDYKNVIGIEEYGYTGYKLSVLKKMKFDKEAIKNKIKELLK